MSLEMGKDEFHIAVLAKHRVDIREIMNTVEPDYIEPNLLEGDEKETVDQKKQCEDNNRKAIAKAKKESTTTS